MVSPRWYEAPPGTVYTDFRKWEGSPPAIREPSSESSMARDYAFYLIGVGIVLVVLCAIFFFHL